MSRTALAVAARVALAWATAAGLFLMHSGPVAGMRGCPIGAGTMIRTTVPSQMTGEHAAAAYMADLMDAVLHLGLSTNAANDGTGGTARHGGLCVSVLPRPRFAAVLVQLTGIATAASLHVATDRQAGGVPRVQRLRAPPLTGSALLLTLCVSRT